MNGPEPTPRPRPYSASPAAASAHCEATRANTLAAAQVHATLALAAATLETAPGIVTPGWTEAVMGS